MFATSHAPSTNPLHQLSAKRKLNQSLAVQGSGVEMKELDATLAADRIQGDRLRPAVLAAACATLSSTLRRLTR